MGETLAVGAAEDNGAASGAVIGGGMAKGGIVGGTATHSPLGPQTLPEPHDF